MTNLLRDRPAPDQDQSHLSIQHQLAVLHDLLVSQKTIKDFYTTNEIASVLKKRPYTVREWCRYRRIHAVKRACGRGRSKDWAVSHSELTRIQNEGLLPVHATAPLVTVHGLPLPFRGW